MSAIVGTSDTQVDVNSFWSLFAALLLAVIGAEVFIIQPEWVRGLVTYAGFDDKQAGFIAAAEMSGTLLTTISLVLLAPRLNWRRVFAVALLLMAVGNFVTILIADFTAFMIVRFIIGIGTGAVMSLSFAIVGLTANADRYFGWLMVCTLVYAGIVIVAMPAVYQSAGMAGALVFFGVLAACGLPFLRFVPTSGQQHVQEEIDTRHISWGFKLTGLGAMLSFFLGLGAVWAYLSLIGVNGGLTEQPIASSMALAQAFGIAGGATAALLAARVGRAIPLSLAIGGLVGSVLLLLGDLTVMRFAVAVCLFVYGWNVAHPYLLAAMASFAPSSRVVVFAVAMQTTGLAVGPWLAANLVSEDGYAYICWCGIGLLVLSLCLILPPVLRQAELSKS